MDLSGPAFATGGIFDPAFTVIFIVSRAIAPLLSVTFNSNKYTPCTSEVTVVAEEVELLIVNDEGPEIFVHR